MRNQTLRYRLLGLMIAVCGGAGAWDSHRLITSKALSIKGSPVPSVTYVPLDQALGAGVMGLEARRTPDLLSALKLNKGYRFDTKLDESVGRDVSPLEVLAIYSDEPDWGADQDLFEPDQYPELWNDDMPYVAERSGLGSQGFRHMFFPGVFRWSDPIGSFQIPMRPLGEAPERARLFCELSRSFGEAGQSYWQYRFLAWAIHYVQDLFQPFHSRQTPSKSFIRFKMKWFVIPAIDIGATADRIAYYHLGYEAWAVDHTQPEGKLRPVLGGNEVKEWNIEGDLATFAKERVVPFAAERAGAVASDLIDFLPPPVARPGGKPKDTIGTEAWRASLRPSAAEESLTRRTGEIYGAMAEVTRSIVRYCTSGR